MPQYRYRTWDALTRRPLLQDLQLGDVEFGPRLNAAGEFSGEIPVRLPLIGTEVLAPGATLLTVERDGLGLWGGIVWRTEPDGAALPVEASGWGSYLHRRHDLHGMLNGRGPWVNADPCKVVRDVWAYAQEAPDGDLGVVVDPVVSQAKVGSPAEPYRSDWWEMPVLGDIVDDMVKVEGGPEWTEDTVWEKGVPRGRIRLGWPRLGTRRTDIAFTTGVNVISAPPQSHDGDEFAQVVIALGAGEGRARRRAVDAVRDGRLRLESVLEVPGERGEDRLAARARTERLARQILGEITDIDVIDHPAAPVGSWQVGDDVPVRVDGGWGQYAGWCRITGWTIRPPRGKDPEQITLHLRRSDRYTYGG
ncbi:hypothetical protein ACN20G_33385 (plasmid) [Streptomyces sp. BI20]|uniref:hypothetical protein n=1 Tax=Streptomyces sp. BI20 TaxID=3403460 RepID=UPI003C7952DF